VNKGIPIDQPGNCGGSKSLPSWRLRVSVKKTKSLSLRKEYSMSLLNQKGKKDEKKGSKAPKNAQSKFIQSKATKSTGGSKKGMMTGGAQRGS
jgi:hypothetical protein